MFGQGSTFHQLSCLLLSRWAPFHFRHKHKEEKCYRMVEISVVESTVPPSLPHIWKFESIYAILPSKGKLGARTQMSLWPHSPFSTFKLNTSNSTTSQTNLYFFQEFSGSPVFGLFCSYGFTFPTFLKIPISNKPELKWNNVASFTVHKKWNLMQSKYHQLRWAGIGVFWRFLTKKARFGNALFSAGSVKAMKCNRLK